MKRLILTLFCAALALVCSRGQTVRSLGVNTTNGHVLSGYSPLTFSNALAFTTNTLADTTRQNLSLPWSGLTNASASGFRSALELSASWLTNTNASNFRGAVGLGWSALTNSNAATALLGLTTSGQVVANTGTNVLTFTNAANIAGISINENGVFCGSAGVNFDSSKFLGNGAVELFNWNDDTRVSFALPIEFANTTNAATTRTNLSLRLPALTNTSNVTLVRALAGSTNTSEPYSGTFYVTDPEASVTWQLTFSNGILLTVSEL